MSIKQIIFLLILTSYVCQCDNRGIEIVVSDSNNGPNYDVENEVDGTEVFEHKYCLLSCVDQTRENCHKAIRKAMDTWDGKFVNNALKKHNQELKFTVHQHCCKKRRREPRKDEISIDSYIIKQECVDLVINFVKPGDPNSPFRKRSGIMFDGSDNLKKILLNDEENFTTRRITDMIGHELGHFLGLCDSWQEESIMCTTCANTRVEDVDVENLVEVLKKGKRQRT